LVSVLFAPSACGKVLLGAEKQANEVTALSQLKKYSTAQAWVSVETGRYLHSLPELYEYAGRGGVLDEALLNAWDRAPDPVPLNGYLFTEVEQDESGARLTDPWRCGLSAFPAIPGRSGDHVMLVLMDDRSEPSDLSPVSDGGWRLYRARVEDLSGPIRRWPSPDELQTKFEERTIRIRRP
jgi:hypothetical protein